MVQAHPGLTLAQIGEINPYQSKNIYLRQRDKSGRLIRKQPGGNVLDALRKQIEEAPENDGLTKKQKKDKWLEWVKANVQMTNRK